MTPEELAEIEARLLAATPGPWHKLAVTTERGYGTHVVSLDQPGSDGPEGQVAVWLHGRNVAAGLSGNDADFIAHAPADIARLLAEVRRLSPALAKVRRLSPAVKAPRKPPCKVAVWGPVRGDWGVAALRVNKRIKAHYNVWEGTWLAYTDGVGAKYFDTEPEARAHIEAWAASKGWEVRNGE